MIDSEIPTDCKRAWRVLLGIADPELYRRRGGWLSNRDVVMTTGHPCDDRKVRKLRDKKLVDWRHEVAPGRGRRVSHRVAAVPGNGREYDAETGLPVPVATALAPVLPSTGDGRLFDYPAQPVPRAGAATR